MNLNEKEIDKKQGRFAYTIMSVIRIVVKRCTEGWQVKKCEGDTQNTSIQVYAKASVYIFM